MNESVDEQLVDIAERVSELEGGTEIARQLFSLAASIDDLLSEHWRDVSNGAQEFMHEAWELAAKFHCERADKRIESDRKRSARLLAASDRWQGSYTDAVALIEQAAVKEMVS